MKNPRANIQLALPVTFYGTCMTNNQAMRISFLILCMASVFLTQPPNTLNKMDPVICLPSDGEKGISIVLNVHRIIFSLLSYSNIYPGCHYVDYDCNIFGLILWIHELFIFLLYSIYYHCLAFAFYVYFSQTIERRDDMHTHSY